jgi:CRP/FNR family transcriptional regulator, cyclic AMP receptor protein
VAWTCDRADLAVLVRALQGVEPVEALTEQLQLVELPRGHTIYAEGDQADCLYIVIAGKVKIGRRSPDGRQRMMGIMGPADMFGAVSMFDSGRRTADASAVTDVRAVSMDRIALRILMTGYPEMAEQLLGVLARRLRLTDNTLAALISADGPGRLAKQLLQLAQRFGTQEDEGLRVTHDLTQEELAHLIGASRETVNKALANFTNRGWLRVDGRSVLIFEPQRLARRAR